MSEHTLAKQNNVTKNGSKEKVLKSLYLNRIVTMLNKHFGWL